MLTRDLGLPIFDIRSRLPQAGWSIGVRAATTSITWHYNGPAVAPERQSGAGLIAQLIADARHQMRAGWGGTINGAPQLMYHFVIDALGTIYLTADIFAILWHCAHADGNGQGLALHFPLGGDQQPTALQLTTAIRLTDALRLRCSISRERVLGHLEWKHATACPGAHLMQSLRAYRGGQSPTVQPTPVPANLRRFLLTCAGKANVRQGPGTSFPIAGTLKSGTVVYVDVTKLNGGPVDGNRTWVHMARVPHEQADLGFLSETLGRWL